MACGADPRRTRVCVVFALIQVRSVALFAHLCCSHTGGLEESTDPVTLLITDYGAAVVTGWRREGGTGA